LRAVVNEPPRRIASPTPRPHAAASGFPAALLLPSGPAGLGEILDAGFVLFRRSLPRCLPFALLAVLLGQGPSVYALGSGQALALGETKDALWWLLMVVAGLGTLGSWLMIMLRQRGTLVAAAGGRAADLLADLRCALRLLPSSLLLLLLAALAVGLGSLLLVLPGVYLLVAFWPALPIHVFEDRPVRDSLDAALQLVRRKWRHLALTLLVVAMSLLALFVIGSLCGVLLVELTGSATLAAAPWVSGVVSGVLGALFQPLLSAFTLAAYADLQQRAA